MPKKKPTGRPLPFSGNYAPNPLTEPLIGAFEFAEAHSSQRTQNTYKSSLRVFADWLQIHSGIYSTTNSWPLHPTLLTVEMVIDFRKAAGRVYKSATVRNRVAAVISYLTWLEGRNELPKGFDLSMLSRQSTAVGRKQRQNMAEYIVNYDMPRQRIPQVIDWYNRQPLPQSYIKRIAFLRDRALLNVMFFTAARLSEIHSINCEQVADGQLQLIVNGKGDKFRTIHIDEQCQEYIQEYLKMRRDKHAALFIPHSGNTTSRRLSRKSIGQIVKLAFAHLGLHPDLSCHDIRHYRATDLLRRKDEHGNPLITLAELQEFLGHASLVTTRDIYAPILGADHIASTIHKLGR